MKQFNTKNLKNKIKRMKEVNDYSPFPIYDTDEIKDLENLLESLEDDVVECCSKCKNLAIKDDEFGNGICQKCLSVNEIEELENMEEWIRKYNHIWNY